MKHLLIIIALLFCAGAISCKNRPNQTVCLLHFDNAVRDVGPHRHTLTVANVSVSGTQSVFGGKSGYFGEGPTITIADHVDFYFKDKFCIDVWIYIRHTEVGNINLFKQEDDAFNFFYFAYDNANGNLEASCKNFATPFSAGGETLSVNVNLSADTWYHLALTFDGWTWRLFVNGTKVGELLRQGSFSMPDLADDPTLNITGNPLTTYYLDEYRIVNGSAVWVNSFGRPKQPYRLPRRGGRSSNMRFRYEG